MAESSGGGGGCSMYDTFLVAKARGYKVAVYPILQVYTLCMRHALHLRELITFAFYFQTKRKRKDVGKDPRKHSAPMPCEIAEVKNAST